MTFPAIVATAESSTDTAGTTHAITMPSPMTAGQLLIVVASKGSTSASFNALTNWTELLDEAAANGVTVWAKQVDGTEGASVNLTSSASTRSARIAFVISGATPLATQAPQLSTAATATSTAPDATICTPTGGAKDYLWISFFSMAGEGADSDTWVTAVPSGFSSPALQKTCGTVGTNLGGLIAASYRTLNAASLDAAAFTAPSLTWRAYTIAVHPATQIPPIVPTMPTMAAP